MNWDINTLMGLAQSMQGSLGKVGEKVEEKFKDIRSLISVGGGSVCLEMDGMYKILRLDINPDLLNDKNMLQDLIILAVNQAVDQVRTERKSKISVLGVPTDFLGGIV